MTDLVAVLQVFGRQNLYCKEPSWTYRNKEMTDIIPDNPDEFLMP